MEFSSRRNVEMFVLLNIADDPRQIAWGHTDTAKASTYQLYFLISYRAIPLKRHTETIWILPCGCELRIDIKKVARGFCKDAGSVPILISVLKVHNFIIKKISLSENKIIETKHSLWELLSEDYNYGYRIPLTLRTQYENKIY